MKTLAGAASFLAITTLIIAGFTQPGGAKGSKGAPAPPQTLQVDLDHALPVALPHLTADLKPVSFKTPDGNSGWVLRIPGDKPIATPAYADGMLFVGGGYGSHEFYAFNANTGELVWMRQTGDDGPTAAVVEGGYVGFNTESCTVVVVDEKTGKIVWQEWLGDPLMSQPAISKDRLFIAYPAGQHNKGGSGYHLLAADLKTGKHLWEQEIGSDVISAPVISNDVVYITTLEGTSYAITAADGKVLWKKTNAATAAPLVVNGEVVVTRREQDGKAINEGLARLDAAKGDQKNRDLLAKDKADYLAAENHGGMALQAETYQKLDSAVGFSTPPPSAKLAQAASNVGVSNVVGAWSYQGSRAAYSQGQVLNAQGRMLNSIHAADGSTSWRAEATGKKVTDAVQVFAPPALGKNNMYLTSALGYLVSVRQKDGKVQFSYALGTPMVFQPALANGNVYAGSVQGILICIKTGQRDADGWYSWGGNAQHNKSY